MMPEIGPRGKGADQASETRHVVAAGHQAAQEVGGVTFFDLATAAKVTRNMVGPQFSISYRGYVGRGSARGIEELQAAVKGRRMTSPTPRALEIHFDDLDPRVIYGVPRARWNASYLGLEWSDQGRMVTANFQAILQAKEVEIAQGMRLLIRVEYMKHPQLDHCVKLSWDNTSFVPMNEAGEDGEQG